MTLSPDVHVFIRRTKISAKSQCSKSTGCRNVEEVTHPISETGHHQCVDSLPVANQVSLYDNLSSSIMHVPHATAHSTTVEFNPVSESLPQMLNSNKTMRQDLTFFVQRILHEHNYSHNAVQCLTGSYLENNLVLDFDGMNEDSQSHGNQVYTTSSNLIFDESSHEFCGTTFENDAHVEKSFRANSTQSFANESMNTWSYPDNHQHYTTRNNKQCYGNFMTFDNHVDNVYGDQAFTASIHDNIMHEITVGNVIESSPDNCHEFSETFFKAEVSETDNNIVTPICSEASKTNDAQVLHELDEYRPYDSLDTNGILSNQNNDTMSNRHNHIAMRIQHISSRVTHKNLHGFSIKHYRSVANQNLTANLIVPPTIATYRSKKVVENRDMGGSVQSKAMIPKKPEHNFLDSDADDDIGESNNTPKSKNSTQKSAKHRQIDGRRITDITFFVREILDSLKALVKRCSHGLDKVKDTDYFDKSMRTRVTFECSECENNTSVWTDPGESNTQMSIIKGAVLGTLTSGSGYSTFQKELAAVGVPFVSPTTYLKVRRECTPLIDKVATDVMNEAAILELKIAEEKGNITPDGKGLIYAEGDGRYGTRSYGEHGFNALSGAAAILGCATGKVIDTGVRNKYCYRCTRLWKQNKDPGLHDFCYRNFDRNKSTCAMEADIMRELFGRSVEKYNLIYKWFVSDREASVFKAILDLDPYLKWAIIPEKIDCVNHLLRNLSNALEKIRNHERILTGEGTSPEYGKVGKYREYIKKFAWKMRRCIENLVRYYIQQKDMSLMQQTVALAKDMMSKIDHFFGDHSHCDLLKDDCDKCEDGIATELKGTNIYGIVTDCIRTFSGNAKHLLLNKTTNNVERFNSVAVGLDSGKRINEFGTNSYYLRNLCAVIQYNTFEVLTRLFIGDGKIVPTVITNMEASRRAQLVRNSIYRQTHSRNHRRWHGPDENYGPLCQQPDEDMLPELYEIEKVRYLEKMDGYYEPDKRAEIERETRDQNIHGKWGEYRREMLTASLFKEICTMQASTSCALIVKKIRSPPDFSSIHTRYGKDNEESARDLLSKQLNCEIVCSGLVVDVNHGFLGASPDGLIEPNGLVEIKCLSKGRHYTPEDALLYEKTYRNMLRKSSDGKLELNPKHQYWYQIQGQLHITQRQYCILALYTDHGLKQVRVEKDDDFWNNRMLEHLTTFYYDCLLPEIIDSRLRRGLPIKDPEYRQKAKEKAAEKREERKKNIAAKKTEGKKKRVRTIHTVSKRIRKSDHSNTNEDLSNEASEMVADDCDIAPLPRYLTKALEKNRPWVVQIDDDNLSIDADTREALLGSMRATSVADAIENIRYDPTRPLINNFLQDSTLHLYLEIIERNSNLSFSPIIYFAHQRYLEVAPGENNVNIIGGTNTQHWCCVHYNGSEVCIYDSLNRMKLDEREHAFITKRYEHKNNGKNIIFHQVTQQPDGTSCGVYAAAFVASIALGDDPAEISYSKDIITMRNHLIGIIEQNTITAFPTEWNNSIEQ